MKNKKYPARKLKWKDIQITRVKLNPEQAVLACCDSVGRGAYLTQQCTPSGGTYCGNHWGYVSS